MQTLTFSTIAENEISWLRWSDCWNFKPNKIIEITSKTPSIYSELLLIFVLPSLDPGVVFVCVWRKYRIRQKIPCHKTEKHARYKYLTKFTVFFAIGSNCPSVFPTLNNSNTIPQKRSQHFAQSAKHEGSLKHNRPIWLLLYEWLLCWPHSTVLSKCGLQTGPPMHAFNYSSLHHDVGFKKCMLK